MKKSISLICIMILLISCVSTKGIRDKYAEDKPHWVNKKPSDDEVYSYAVGGPSPSLDIAKQMAYRDISRIVSTEVDAVTTRSKDVTVTEEEQEIQEELNQMIKTSSLTELFGVESAENWRNSSTGEWWVLIRVSKADVEKALEKKKKELEEKRRQKEEEKEALSLGMKEALNTFVMRSTIKGNCAVGEFFIEDTPFISDFSGYLKDMTVDLIQKENLFPLIDSDEYYSLLKNTGFDPNREVRGGIRAEDLQPSGVDNIIYGKYWVSGEDITVYLTLKELLSGKILGTGSFTVIKRALPQGISLKTRNQGRIESINSRIPVMKSDFALWPDRGNGGVYSPGETLILNFKSPVEGYVRVYHISAEGEMTLVFPNRFDGDNRVEAGKLYRIGGLDYPFQFDITEPYGIESFKAVFSPDPYYNTQGFNEEESFFLSGIRGLKISRQIHEDLENSDSSTVVSCYYNIIRKSSRR